MSLKNLIPIDMSQKFEPNGVRSVSVTTTLSLEKPIQTDVLLGSISENLKADGTRKFRKIEYKKNLSDSLLSISIEGNSLTDLQFHSEPVEEEEDQSDRIRLTVKTSDTSHIRTSIRACFKEVERVKSELKSLWRSEGEFSISVEFSNETNINHKETTVRKKTSSGFLIEIFDNKIRVSNVPAQRFDRGISDLKQEIKKKVKG